MIPLMPSPGSPKIVSTPQSARRSISASAAILPMAPPRVGRRLGLGRAAPASCQAYPRRAGRNGGARRDRVHDAPVEWVGSACDTGRLAVPLAGLRVHRRRRTRGARRSRRRSRLAVLSGLGRPGDRRRAPRVRRSVRRDAGRPLGAGRELRRRHADLAQSLDHRPRDRRVPRGLRLPREPRPGGDPPPGDGGRRRPPSPSRPRSGGRLRAPTAPPLATRGAGVGHARPGDVRPLVGGGGRGDAGGGRPNGATSSSSSTWRKARPASSSSS